MITYFDSKCPNRSLISSLFLAVMVVVTIGCDNSGLRKDKANNGNGREIITEAALDNKPQVEVVFMHDYHNVKNARPGGLSVEGQNHLMRAIQRDVESVISRGFAVILIDLERQLIVAVKD